MSTTTRHLINRQRRLAAAGARTAGRPVRDRDDATEADDRTDAPAGGRMGGRTGVDTAGGAAGRAATAVRPRRAASADAPASAADRALPAAEAAGGGEDAATPRRTLASRLPARFPLTVALLALLTVLLGGFAAWAAGKASALHDGSATSNTALTDNARTAEIKGQIAQDVNSVFSYDYSDTARTDTAAKKVLTGKAVQQYATMIAQVKAAAPKQKLVLTTTVTDTGVEMIDGDRARVLVYADQANTSTAKGANAGSAYSAAMFAVDAVRQGGGWKIASIDTFG
ncbi:putative integral membrane protein [Actinacidiphila reveromycinica]|uniref:Putative integral membrane protein n=1 Tax=Actinacidiphila reveromycinica TaxID=659352 RepID=A0A7U3UQV4_9ACTN|nr:nuclear transport factor 2 family protein [Streptomyces sp. SN-593]BBA96993.1 putative integral membrane protein [Streptomyces sp. SN-593]